jgi:hypothetical protein
MQEVVWESFSQGDGGFVGVDADYNIVWDFNRYAAAAAGAIGGAGVVSGCLWIS